MNSHDSITQDQVKSLFDYQEDGRLLWKFSGKGIAKNRIAGSYGKSTGYFSVMINKKNYLMHRVIFLMHHGYFPPVVDHIDMDKTNNKITNLRASDHTTNKGNCTKKSQNKSGYKGVCWAKQNKKYQATITQNYTTIHLGFYDDKVDAALAYNQAALKYFGEFARLNEIP
jgi:hypothetical protein